jgi:hypothetical protein
MHFHVSIFIKRSPEVCFAFLRDKDTFPQELGSPVLVLDKITPGPVRVGTRYREVVQMFPFVRGEILSEITRFEPPEWLDEKFDGPGSMYGNLSYQFIPEQGGTHLIQRETLQTRGWTRVFGPIIRRMLEPRLRNRLGKIKEILAGGWERN